MVENTARSLRAATTPASRTLEIGTGPGQYRYVVPGHFVGVDISIDPYRDGVARRVDAAADAHALPFRQSFDVVFLCSVFHLLDGPRALAEIARVLKPGGRILIFDYSRETLAGLASSAARMALNAEVTVRRAAEWIELLSSEGFSDVEVSSSSPKRLRKALKLLPSSLYFRLLDRREGAIIISGRRR